MWVCSGPASEWFPFFSRLMDLKRFILWVVFGDRRRTLVFTAAAVCDWLILSELW